MQNIVLRVTILYRNGYAKVYGITNACTVAINLLITINHDFLFDCCITVLFFYGNTRRRCVQTAQRPQAGIYQIVTQRQICKGHCSARCGFFLITCNTVCIHKILCQLCKIRSGFFFRIFPLNITCRIYAKKVCCAHFLAINGCDIIRKVFPLRTQLIRIRIFVCIIAFQVKNTISLVGRTRHGIINGYRSCVACCKRWDGHGQCKRQHGKQCYEFFHVLHWFYVSLLK